MNTYKEDEERLYEAIESYLCQRDVDIQLIISTVKKDISVPIARKMKLDVSQSLKPGIYRQMNQAISLVRGDWFCCAGGNDRALPTKMIDEINTCLMNNKKVCYSDFYYTDKDMNITGRASFFEYDYSKHLSGNFVYDDAIVRIDMLRKYTPFNENFGNYAYWDFWLRIAEVEGNVFAYNKNPELLYRIDETSRHIIIKNNNDNRDMSI
jgi:hypothetical protein